MPSSWMCDELQREMDAYILNCMEVAVGNENPSIQVQFQLSRVKDPVAISNGQQYGTGTGKAYYLKEERGNEVLVIGMSNPALNMWLVEMYQSSELHG
ncbi:hypothetical protein llap_8544 [Limosa lapponica baueri]|uniref:Uncharacterized protein n=1 Tax=Limosa lapponica baueri TaxID=1758121 RepID=A0A2I0U592_LIMLA|nr:hypothetical protein llap_8544 [Limosa lapponica baueri]